LAPTHAAIIIYAATSSDSAPKDGLIVDENEAIEMTMNDNTAYVSHPARQ
jgi:hypothetical protein